MPIAGTPVLPAPLPALADPERALAISYAPISARSGLHALLALDAVLGGIVRGDRDPMVAQLRLTWWFEALVGLDTAPPPAEPILATVAQGILPHGISGASLAQTIDGWEILLEPHAPDDAALRRFAEARAVLFGGAARVLGHPGGPALAAAGQGWALIDLARQVRDPSIAARSQALARAVLVHAPRYWSPGLRALGAMAMLARGDANRPLDQQHPVGSPGRVARMAWHRLTGR